MKNLKDEIYMRAYVLDINLMVRLYEKCDNVGIIFIDTPKLDILVEFLGYFTDYNWQSYFNEFGKFEISLCKN